MVLLAYLYVYAFWFSLPFLCLAALKWGGWPEQMVAFLFLTAAASSVFLKSSVTGGYGAVEAGVVVTDIVLLVSLVLITLRADRWWLIWVTALQAISTAGHLAKAITPGLSRMAYSMMVGASSYPALILLGAGIISNFRRTRRNAAEKF